MSKPYIPDDRLARKARREGFKARSVYKLMELNEKYHLLYPGQFVLDLGAAPGSWLQYSSEQVGHSGKVIGVDLTEIPPIAPNVITKVADLNDLSLIENLLALEGIAKVDLILSDAAPKTSGIANFDHGQSLDLARSVFALAKKFLNPNGKLVMKVFYGSNFNHFIDELKIYFRTVVATKSHASRDRSSELYVVCH